MGGYSRAYVAEIQRLRSERDTLLAALEDFPKPPRGNPLMRPDWWDAQLQDFWEDARDWYDNQRHAALLLSANLR